MKEKGLKKSGMQTKKVIEHHDMFGYKLEVGDTIVYSHYSKLCVGMIKKINRVNIKVWNVKNTWKWYTGDSIKSNEVIKVPEKDVTLFILKQKV